MVSRHRQNRAKIARPQTVLVISQDTGGVFTYLQQRLRYNAPAGGVSIQVMGSGSASKTMLAEARVALAGGKGDIPAADHVALVFDRDNDHHFKNVLETVNSHNCMSAFVSVPCFEYFFILHFGVNRGSCSGAADVIAALKILDGFSEYSKAGKAVPIFTLKQREADALANAKAVRTACSADGALIPWTNVDELFEFVETARSEGIDKATSKPLSRWVVQP